MYVSVCNYVYLSHLISIILYILTTKPRPSTNVRASIRMAPSEIANPSAKCHGGAAARGRDKSGTCIDEALSAKKQKK